MHSAFVGYEELSRSWRLLSTSSDFDEIKKELNKFRYLQLSQLYISVNRPTSHSQTMAFERN